MLYSKSIHFSNERCNTQTTCCFAWLDEFLEDVLSQNIPIDFVVTHSYPNQLSLQNINTWIDALQTQGIDVVNKYNSKYNLDLPMIISEYNSGCCINAFDDGKFWNDDNFYASAFLIFWAKHLQPLFSDNSPLQWMSYWAISDVFEEGGFNSNEFSNLYGLQTIRGVPKPSFRAFELLQQYGSEIEYESRLIDDDNGYNESTSTVQVYCLKNANDEGRYGLFVANWNNYGFDISEQNVTINIANYIDDANGLKSVVMYRIDENNTAPLSVWIEMGSPEYPTEEEMQALNAASQLKAMSIKHQKIDETTVQLNLNIPVYGAAVLDLHY